MALTTTPGSETADSFATLAACDAYCEAQGLTDWTSVADSPADPKEAALRRATAFLSSAFTWKGTRTNGRSQALAWPRTDVEDGEGEAVASDDIPVEIIQATCLVAAKEVASPGYMNPAVVLADRVKRERVGPIEVEYLGGAMTPEASRPILMQLDDLVSGLVAAGNGGGLAGSAVRS